MIAPDENISATIVACPRCSRRFYCNPEGNCWCMALASDTDDADDSSDAACLCPDCLAEREA